MALSGWYGRHRVMVLTLAISVFGLGICCATSSRSDEMTDMFGQTSDLQRIAEARNAELVVLWTGWTKGNFEPCGCGGMNDGGFSRRATVIEGFRDVSPNTVVVDTGNLAVSGSDVQLEYIAKSYARLNYDAILAGRTELRVGLDTFNELDKTLDLPWLASNLRPKKESCIDEVITVKRGGRKIAIIGILGKRHYSMLPRDMQKQFTFEDPYPAAKRLLDTWQSKVDVVILLTNLLPEDREQFKEKPEGATVWIDCGTGRKNGIDADELEIKAADEGGKPLPQPLQAWPNDTRIGVACLKLDRSQATASWLEWFVIGRQIEQQNDYLEIYDAYRYASIQRIIPRPIARDKAAKDIPFKYAPPEKCKSCHAEQYAFWADTPHAHAFETLIQAERADDPLCWSCHTIGFGEVSGFISADRTAELKNVGCQMCHRVDMRTHPDTLPPKRGAYNLVKSWQCRRCHVSHRSPAYVHSSYLKRASCPKMKDYKGPDAKIASPNKSSH